jgi:multidrug efflux pump subunit AcrB
MSDAAVAALGAAAMSAPGEQPRPALRSEPKRLVQHLALGARASRADALPARRLLVLGFAAYFQLGQDEDPPFTFRAMAIRVFWPGATAQQVAEQVTDKLEKTLQEVPYADRIRSYSKPGEALILFQVRDSSPPKEMPQIWYTVRKKLGDLRGTCRRASSARSSTTSSATSTARSTRSRPTATATPS